MGGNFGGIGSRPLGALRGSWLEIGEAGLARRPRGPNLPAKMQARRQRPKNGAENRGREPLDAPPRRAACGLGGSGRRRKAARLSKVGILIDLKPRASGDWRMSRRGKLGAGSCRPGARRTRVPLREARLLEGWLLGIWKRVKRFKVVVFGREAGKLPGGFWRSCAGLGVLGLPARSFGA